MCSRLLFNTWVSAANMSAMTTLVCSLLIIEAICRNVAFRPHTYNLFNSHPLEGTPPPQSRGRLPNRGKTLHQGNILHQAKHSLLFSIPIQCELTSENASSNALHTHMTLYPFPLKERQRKRKLQGFHRRHEKPHRSRLAKTIPRVICKEMI